MTNKEAKMIIERMLPKPSRGNGKIITNLIITEALELAIKALEQTDVLDKIRAKIEKLQKMCDTNDLNLLSQYSAFGMALDVIDEYKAESEGKNEKTEKSQYNSLIKI